MVNNNAIIDLKLVKNNFFHIKKDNFYINLRWPVIHEKEQKNLRIYNRDHRKLSLSVLLTKKIIAN